MVPPPGELDCVRKQVQEYFSACRDHPSGYTTTTAIPFNDEFLMFVVRVGPDDSPRGIRLLSVLRMNRRSVVFPLSILNCPSVSLMIDRSLPDSFILARVLFVFRNSVLYGEIRETDDAVERRTHIVADAENTDFAAFVFFRGIERRLHLLSPVPVPDG